MELIDYVSVYKDLREEVEKDIVGFLHPRNNILGLSILVTNEDYGSTDKYKVKLKLNDKVLVCEKEFNHTFNQIQDKATQLEERATQIADEIFKIISQEYKLQLRKEITKIFFCRK